MSSSAATGSEYLIFVTNYYAVEGDIYGAQGETDYTNNTFAVPITVTAPDLTITTATAPTSGIANQSINVSWTVKNIGSVAAPGDWYDAVYIGSSPTFNADNDTFVTDFSESKQSPLAAGSSYTDAESITLPATIPTGSEYLIFVTNYYAVEGYYYEAQGETDYANNTFSVPITLSAPDLTITTATAPTSATVGSTISVSWTVQDIGSVAAPGDWYDAVYLGSSPTFNASQDTFVTDFSESKQSPLAAGSSYTDTESITLPATARAVASTLSSSPTTTPSRTSCTTPRRSRARPIIQTTLLPCRSRSRSPDLELVTATAPASGIASGTIDVSWTVQNIGAVAAAGTWYDAVFIGSSPTFNQLDDTLVSSFDEAGRSPLAAGVSYSVANQSITLPNAAIGSEYLIFVTNYYAVEGDTFDSQGETSYANNTYAVPITVSAPDLTITTATAPSSAIEGGSIDVSWTVQNIGSVAAPGDWYDAIFLGSSPTFNASSDVYVDSFSESGYSPLAADGSYTINNQSITLPATGSGNEYLIFVTNYYAVENDISYYEPGQGETSYTNNTFSVAIALSSPDLTVTAINAPASGSTVAVDASIPISWTVENIGSVAALDDWYDYVYLSSTPTLGFEPTYLAYYYAGADSPLAAGASYTPSLDVTIPNDAPLGSEYLIVETDVGESQPESNTSNDMLAIPITITAPDLVITSASITPTSAEAGNDQTVSLTYTVENQGTVAALGYWYDSVYLSSSSVLNSTTDTLIGTFEEDSQSGLAANASYTGQETLTIPNTSAGSDYLIVATNSGALDLGNYYYDEYQEETDYTNNTEAVPITLTVPAVDLAISQPIAPASADVDDTIPIAFTVTNQGSETAQADWTDDVYLGTSPTYSSGDTLLSSYDANEYGDSPLDASASYTISDNIQVPNIAPGSYYIIFVTNDERDSGRDGLYQRLDIGADHDHGPRPHGHRGDHRQRSRRHPHPG